MSEETNQPENNEHIPTPEEMAAYRKNMLHYYKEQLPLLKAQLDYERLIADIEEARVKALTMVIRQAQIKAGPPKERESDPVQPPFPPEEKRSNQEETGKRKLKTQD